MTQINLTFPDEASAIAALAAVGVSATDKNGAAFIPSTTIGPDGSRVDVVIAGNGSGVVMAATGGTEPDPRDATRQVPVYAAQAGFHLSLFWSGPTPPTFPAGNLATSSPVDIVGTPVVVPPVPQQVALWQARAVLAAQNLLTAADAAVAATNDPVLTNVWQYGNFISHDSPNIAKLGAVLGLTSAQIDALFVAADAITA